MTERVVRGIKVHPAADIMPFIEEADWPEFKESVKHGVDTGTLDLIELLDGKIIDGRNRWCALTELKIDPKVWCIEKIGITDPIQYVLDKNLNGRRQLSKSQLGVVAAKLANLKHGSNQYEVKQGEGEESQNCLSSKSIENKTLSEVSNDLGVSTTTIKMARVVCNSGSKELIDAVSSGKISVNKAVDLIKSVSDKKEQTKIIAEGKAKVDEVIKKAELKNLEAALPGSATEKKAVIQAKIETTKEQAEKAAEAVVEEKKKRERSKQYISAEKAVKKLESKEASMLVGFMIQHFKIRKYKMAEQPKPLNIEIPSVLRDERFLDAWNRWIDYRRTINKTLKEVGAKKQLDEFAKHGVDEAIKAINDSIMQGWTGVFPGRKAIKEEEPRRGARGKRDVEGDI